MASRGAIVQTQENIHLQQMKCNIECTTQFLCTLNNFYMLYRGLLCSIVWYMIQGGGPCRASLERHKFTRQIGVQRITIYKQSNVHYIPALHWVGETGHKTHKKALRLGGTHTGQYKMIMGVQTAQQLHQTMHQYTWSYFCHFGENLGFLLGALQRERS